MEAVLHHNKLCICLAHMQTVRTCIMYYNGKNDLEKMQQKRRFSKDI
jgi:hypothetical protein